MNRSEEIRDFLGKDALSGSVHKIRTHAATAARTPDPRRAEFHLIWPAISSLGDQTS